MSRWRRWTVASLLEVDDLVQLDPTVDVSQAAALIGHAEALALATAPCLTDPDFTGGAAVRAILAGAVLRWYHAGNGMVTTQSAGPFSQTVDSSAKRFLFWPSELKALRQLCGGGRSRAFSVSMVP